MSRLHVQQNDLSRPKEAKNNSNKNQLLNFLEKANGIDHNHYLRRQVRLHVRIVYLFREKKPIKIGDRHFFSEKGFLFHKIRRHN